MNNSSKIFNLLFALILTAISFFLWNYFSVDKVKYDEDNQSIYADNIVASKNKLKEGIDRVSLKNDHLSGSINLKGLKFDNLILNNYKENIDADSENIILLKPSSSDESYFMSLGWVSSDVEVPNKDSIWSSDSLEITPGKEVNLTWVNKDGIKFKVSIILDEEFMMDITQSVENNSNKDISVNFYGLIKKSYLDESGGYLSANNNMIHQGMIGSFSRDLNEYSYKDIRKSSKESFKYQKVDWIGISDKYWLTSFIPDQNNIYASNFSFAHIGGKDFYQSDFISKAKNIAAKDSLSMNHKFFAGAKQADTLDFYSNKYDISLFDRTIDFGWFYILTKPIFQMLSFIYKYVGNFGIAIMIVTVFIRLLMFGFTNKSYRSMKKMKKLNPEIERIKATYAHDKMRMNQEMMSLYKKEKVNPISGCLPILLQIPVFFSIYKVLNVTLEMRHSPFFGWIKDLSAADTTSIFNLFGLLPFTPPSFLMIGALPIIMAVTMYLQQRMNPKPADPAQAIVMQAMPFIFLFLFSSFPAGLLVYWSWNNILSIGQQFYVNKFTE